MTILRMRASFGCLQNAELTLAPGLNVLTLPNESGKSTWAQFLLAMFYGVDTTERAKAGSIPAKTKYKPWSGAPMAGEIELDWEGRIIIGYDPFGKQVMKSVYGRTQRDVKEKLERLKDDLEGKSSKQTEQADSDLRNGHE